VATFHFTHSHIRWLETKIERIEREEKIEEKVRTKRIKENSKAKIQEGSEDLVK